MYRRCTENLAPQSGVFADPEHFLLLTAKGKPGAKRAGTAAIGFAEVSSFRVRTAIAVKGRRQIELQQLRERRWCLESPVNPFKSGREQVIVT